MGDKQQDSDNQWLEPFKYVAVFFHFVMRVYEQIEQKSFFIT